MGWGTMCELLPQLEDAMITMREGGRFKPVGLSSVGWLTRRKHRSLGRKQMKGQLVSVLSQFTPPLHKPSIRHSSYLYDYYHDHATSYLL